MKVHHPNMSTGVVVTVAVAILVMLFSVQHYGTNKVGWLFAPAVLLWLLSIGAIGAYNIFKHDVRVLRAFSPLYIVRYFRNDRKRTWASLGGVMLSITGTEALFADLGHFSTLSVQLAALITDILANDFSLADKRTMHNFLSHHQLSREFIVDKLGQALEVLGIAEKNMRGSNTCISGLIATLLKFGQEDPSDISHNSEFEALFIVESAKNDVKEIADDINYIGVKPLNRELTTNITNHGL